MSSAAGDTLPKNGAAPPRAVALVGPQGSGKTTLYESLMATAGAAVRRSGSSRERTMTTELTFGHCQFLGDPWAIIDCPGSVEFAYETVCALEAADIAVVVCDPVPERAPAMAPLLRMLEDRGVPHLLFINKIDSFTGRLRDTLAALQGFSTRPLVLRQVPIRDGDAITGYVDVVSERAYRYRKGRPSERIAPPAELEGSDKDAFAGLVEVLADHDDGILEKIIEELTPTRDEIYRQLHKDQVSNAIVEVLLGAADGDRGTRRLWKALRHDCPGPAETAARRRIAADGEPLLQVIKTVYAAHTGKLSYARIWRGPVKDGAALGGARVNGVYALPNGELTKTGEACAGDLVALGRLEGVATGMTATAAGNGAHLSHPEPPEPVYALAIAIDDRKDEVKLSGALQKLVEEDPSLSVVRNVETGETILRGQGEIHLNAAIARLTGGYRLDIKTAKPRVAYKETIRLPVSQHSRMKRQTGGHGQFADVTIEIAPRERGEGFLFIDQIVGGAIPRQYIPAVAEAAEDATHKGAFGHPVVDIAVTLTDGTFHSVDSSDMAFKNATRMAMTEGLAKGDPIVLEPIHHVTITVPNEFTPNAQRLLSARKAQILGFAARPGWSGWDDIEALMPEAEMHDLIIELRSRTMGVGSYVHRFDHLAEAHGRGG